MNDQYQKFTYTFYDVNAIWLGKDTYDLIQEFSGASRDFLNELESMRESAGAWRLPDGTNPKDRRKGINGARRGRVVGRHRKWGTPREAASRVQRRGGAFIILNFHPAPQKCSASRAYCEGSLR